MVDQIDFPIPSPNTIKNVFCPEFLQLKFFLRVLCLKVGVHWRRRRVYPNLKWSGKNHVIKFFQRWNLSEVKMSNT